MGQSNETGAQLDRLVPIGRAGAKISHNRIPWIPPMGALDANVLPDLRPDMVFYRPYLIAV